jgi:hypothetical protein
MLQDTTRKLTSSLLPGSTPEPHQLLLRRFTLQLERSQVALLDTSQDADVANMAVE